MRCARCGFDTTDLWEMLPEVTALLQREGRVTYRALRRRLDCDDAFFEDLREELLFKKLAVDEDEKGLVWIGGHDGDVPDPSQPPPWPTTPGYNGPSGAGGAGGPDRPSGPPPVSSFQEPQAPPSEQSGGTSLSREANLPISGSAGLAGPAEPQPVSGPQPAEAELFCDRQSQLIAQQDLREPERDLEKKITQKLEREEESSAVLPTRVLIGRDVECGLLQLRWEQSREGFGQVVLISGDAGIGKSRLVEVLATEVIQEGALCLAFQCLPEYQTTAWYPLIACLHHRVQGQYGAILPAPLSPASRPLQEQIHQVEELVRSWHLPLEETVPLLASLLSIPLSEEHYPSLHLSAQQQRQRTQDMLLAWLAAKATETPILVHWADLHWADPSTLEVLELVIDQAPSGRALHVLTFRPAFEPAWAPGSHLTPITLDRLEQAETHALMTQLARGERLPSELVDYVTDKGDGVPLLTEELTLALLESETLTHVDGQYALSNPVAEIFLPTTWQEAFLARLDRVPGGHDVARAGAVFGNECSYEMLKVVTGTATQALQKALAALVQAGIFHQHERLRSVYTFKHTLLRDTVYRAIPEKDRQRLHQRVIRFLEGQSPQLGDVYPELLAYHAAAADNRTQAVSYWQQAGMSSIAHFANAEAMQQLDKSGALLATLPDSGERVPYEFALHVSTGLVQSMTKGCGAAEVEHAYAQARALCQQVPTGPQLAPLYFRLLRFYALRAEYHTAREIAERYQQFAERGGDVAARLGAHAAMGSTSLWLGEYASALEHLEQLNTLYNPDTHRLSVHYGENLKTAGGALMAWTLWYLGYPDQASKASDEALRFAQGLASPVDLTWAFIRSAWLQHHCQEVSLVAEHAAAGVALATEHRLPFLAAVGGVLQGWTLCQQGQTEQSITQIRHGITTAQETGANWGRPYFLALLAEAYERDGQIEEGLGVLVEALGLVRKTDERFCEAELYRLRGELLLARDKRSQAVAEQPVPVTSSSEAEDCLLLAIKIARRQSAKSWELRASASLSRLWQQQGKTEEARQLLDPIYSWFTEGFETPDIQDVQGLLALPR